jgi:hypothetical protein
MHNTFQKCVDRRKSQEYAPRPLPIVSQADGPYFQSFKLQSWPWTKSGIVSLYLTFRQLIKSFS